MYTTQYSFFMLCTYMYLAYRIVHPCLTYMLQLGVECTLCFPYRGLLNTHKCILC